jgi:hypothetical protein
MIALIFFMDLDPVQVSQSYVHWAALYEIYALKNVSKVSNPHNLKKSIESTWDKKGQPGARSSCLRRVWGRVWPLLVLCMQSFPTFLHEAVSRTWTHDFMVTRQQLAPWDKKKTSTIRHWMYCLSSTELILQSQNSRNRATWRWPNPTSRFLDIGTSHLPAKTSTKEIWM